LIKAAGGKFTDSRGEMVDDEMVNEMGDWVLSFLEIYVEREMMKFILIDVLLNVPYYI